MFCNRCGTSLTPNAQFCSGCGKPVVQASFTQAPYAPQPFAQGRVRRHIQGLATLWLINGILRLVSVGWMMVFGTMFFPFMRSWGGPIVWPFGRGWGLDFLLSGSLFSLGIFLGFFGLLHLVLAWGLFERQPWARTLGVVIGFLALLRFPLGTALGIYTLWVLLPEESSREYDRLSQPGTQMHSAPYSS
jgi:hypothetical protein